MHITAIEPAWNGNTHLPANLGLLRLLRHAYPEASLTFVGGQLQIDALIKLAPPELTARMQFIPISPKHDTDTLPADVARQVAMLDSLPESCTRTASLLVLCSCTAAVISAINRKGFAKKSMAFLHGNANDIGWRSRNPFRRFYDLQSSLKTFSKHGGKLLVYEERIKRNLSQQYPWLAKNTYSIGHPLVEEEAPPHGNQKTLGNPIKIGFPGMATIAKGFPDFLNLAKALTRDAPDQYEFHSIGYLHETCKSLDQSMLKTKSDKGLPRKAFIDSLNSMDFLFTWHNDTYYSNAASGVIYDSINLGIPVIAKRSALIDELQTGKEPIGLIFQSTDEAQSFLKSNCPLSNDYSRMVHSISQLRDKYSTPNLAKVLSTIVNS